MNNEKNEKAKFIKRIGAYIIDILLVTLLTTSISMFFVDTKKSEGYTQQLVELTEKCSKNELSNEECQKQSNDLNYYISNDNIEVTIINCGVAIIYYVVLCFYCHGITLGKYLMKLKIVSANDKELNIGHYLIRGLLVNLILSNLVNILCIYFMSKDTYISVYPRISSVLSIFLLVTIMFAMYRNDGRGLHDLISNTKVISTKEPKNNAEVKEEKIEDNGIPKKEIVDASVIHEKEVKKNSDKKKGTTKKSTKKIGGKK